MSIYHKNYQLANNQIVTPVFEILFASNNISNTIFIQNILDFFYLTFSSRKPLERQYC
jgi:hypothetical protein